jgi:hypothetical protein
MLSIFEHAEKLAKVVGVLTAVTGGYVAAGGPIPATVGYVDHTMRPVKIGVLEGQRKTIRADRNFLSNEAATVMRLLNQDHLDTTSRTVLITRKQEIEHQIRELAEEDDSIRKKINDLK